MRKTLASDGNEFFARIESGHRGPGLVDELCSVAWSGAEVANDPVSSVGPVEDSVLIGKGGSADVS